jgi:lipid A 4'-phosphatase
MLGLTKPFVLFFVAAAAVFLIFSEVDIAFSRLFYQPDTGFFLQNARLCRVLYRSVEILTPMWIGLVAVLWIGVWIRKKPIAGLTRKSFLYLFLVLAIGPGLVVNTILKDNWGRARPDMIREFGGNHHFTPAFVLSDACEKNCGFVSGHSAMAFYLMVPGFLYPRFRRWIFAVGFLYGSSVGLVRIVQGGHFLSDVVFSFFVVFATAAVLHYFLFQRDSYVPVDRHPGL